LVRSYEKSEKMLNPERKPEESGKFAVLAGLQGNLNVALAKTGVQKKGKPIGRKKSERKEQTLTTEVHRLLHSSHLGRA